MLLGSDFGSGQVLLSMLWFFLFFIWIWLLIVVFSDIFRSHDLGGFAKALWVIFVIIFPYLGVFVYLIARGGKMQEHAVQAAQQQDQMAKAYIRDAVGSGGGGGGGPAAQVQQLVDLKNQGVIDDAEFERLKGKIVGS